MGRVIGIRHRRKKTREGEARPTMVAIKTGNGIICHELEDDTAELDFLMGRFPVEWRPVNPGEDVSVFQMHHCKWRRAAKDEDVSKLNTHYVHRMVDKKGLPVVEVITKVPTVFDGLRKDDKVVMVLGGSGDRFAAALSRKGEDIGAKVFRLPPFSLSDNRNGEDKKDDHLTLIRIFEKELAVFYKVRQRDRDLIRVKEALIARQDAMKQRIACEQRILQSLVGNIFLNEEGCFPEGVVEDQFDKAKANDVILQALVQEEERRDKELARAVKSLDIWERIFENIKGVGPRVAAGIIAPIGDIRRFIAPNGAAKLKKFCGVHVLDDGRFPRRRGGEVANWSPQARQALYLLADQFNRRPDSDWGKKLLQYKQALREKHPEPIEVKVNGNGEAGKTIKRYTNGHIHKMAQWRTLTRFVEWLYRQWVAIESEKVVV
ncbi:MAG: transposase [Candidatus Nealsonbacteria bacterium]|nr:transposase [Candidatus Nealsonbacteria bacterium]